MISLRVSSFELSLVAWKNLEMTYSSFDDPEPVRRGGDR